MIEITNEISEVIAVSLIEQIEDSNYYNGCIEVTADEVYYTLQVTVLIYRNLDFKITRILPVWWEFSTNKDNENQPNDFHFGMLQEQFEKMLW